ncbi:MAG TPA: LPS export ABC transporter periplasmic protein LptC [Gemmatirosa sp.]
MTPRRAAVVLLAASGAAACNAKGPTALAASRALPDSAEQVMFGLRLQQTNAGVRKSVLFADTGFFYNDNTLVDLRRVRIVFFSNAGDSNAVMTGRTGRYDTRTQRVDGWVDVVVTSTDGRRLTSPHLVYERSVNQISSDTSFTFTEPGRTLQGIGFRSDPQLRNVQVLKSARGRTVIPPQSESPAGPVPTPTGAGAGPGATGVAPVTAGTTPTAVPAAPPPAAGSATPTVPPTPGAGP